MARLIAEDDLQMNTDHINTAAEYLINRRHTSNRDRLPQQLRPETTQDALKIQQASIQIMSEIRGARVGGWKTVLPAGDRLNVAPIFSDDVHRLSPCPIRLEKGVCRIEPEIGFRFAHALPPRDSAYSDDEIIAAIGSTHMALELIENRYAGTEEISYLENLADCLFNQGLYLGPEIPKAKAIDATGIEFTLSQGGTKTFKGTHPNQGPILPVLWLANFLRERGIGIEAGQVVITGSFAGVHEVLPDHEFTLEYGGLGSITLTFTK